MKLELVQNDSEIEIIEHGDSSTFRVARWKSTQYEKLSDEIQNIIDNFDEITPEEVISVLYGDMDSWESQRKYRKC